MDTDYGTISDFNIRDRCLLMNLNPTFICATCVPPGYRIMTGNSPWWMIKGSADRRLMTSSR